MNVEQAYNSWAVQYDTNDNKTRDLEAIALREMLDPIAFERCLEIGCGTGKNTLWLAEKATELTAIDLSEAMLEKARGKITAPQVSFQQADITGDWYFAKEKVYQLISFSLVLEHLQDLAMVFKKAAACLDEKGYIYIGELHPFKQYTGSKARFDTAAGRQILTCFDHHVSDFIQSARPFGLEVCNLQEYFDKEEKQGLPRILAILLQKK